MTWQTVVLILGLWYGFIAIVGINALTKDDNAADTQN